MVEAVSVTAFGSRLVERERELRRLDAAIAGAVAGHAAVVMVEGPAGIGKTRLLAEGRSRALAAGLRPLAARGSEPERRFTFGVVRQLFEGLLLEPAVGKQALAGAAAGAEAVFGTVEEHEPANPRVDPPLAALHGLYWLVTNLSAQDPLWIAVDDLHWCDRPSLRFLGYLARRLQDLPLVIACGARSSEPGLDRVLLGEVAANDATVTLRPGPLSRGAVAELVAARLGPDPDPGFCAACHDATGGNPRLIEELVTELDAVRAPPDAAHVGTIADVGPRAASRTVLPRLARLPREALAAARAVAVLGDGAEPRQLATLAGLGEARTWLGLHALLQAEILRAEPELGFVHPLVAAAVYRDIPPPQRGRDHEHAARLLRDAGAPVERIAAHLLGAARRGQAWVVDALLEAGRRSLRGGAADDAVAYLSRALDEPPVAGQRATVLIELGHAEMLTRGPDAAKHLSEVYKALDDPVARAKVARTLVRARLLIGQPVAATQLATTAIDELPAGEPELRAELECCRALAAFSGGRDAAVRQRILALPSRPIPDGTAGKMLAAAVAREWTFSGGTSEQCAALALRALAGGQLVAADNAHLAVSAITTLARADREEAIAAWERSRAQAHRDGSLLARAGISLGLGFTLYRRGELTGAERSLRAAIDEFALWRLGADPASIRSVSLLALVLVEQGRLREARRELGRRPDPGDSSEAARYRCDAQLALLIAERDYDQARMLAGDVAHRFRYLENPVDTPWRSHLALALDGLGDHQEALATAGEDLALARRWGAPGSVARALRVIGVVQRGAGLARLREAVSVAAASPARLEHAKALAALGRALRQARRPREARAALRDAIARAEICGAGDLVEHARSELAAAGGRPRASALNGPAALTASERRVVALAVEGQTNREIAQALFVSAKTVEMHLGHAYRKLAIRSRRELAVTLAGS